MSRLTSMNNNHSMSGLIESFNITTRKSFSIDHCQRAKNKVFLSPIPNKHIKPFNYNHINSFHLQSNPTDNLSNKLKGNRKIYLTKTVIKRQSTGLNDLIYFHNKNLQVRKCRNIFRKNISNTIDHSSHQKQKSEKSKYFINEPNSYSKKKSLSLHMSLISYHLKINSLIQLNEDKDIHIKEIKLNITNYFETIDKIYDISYDFKCHNYCQSPLEIFSIDKYNMAYMTLIKMQIIVYTILSLAIKYLSLDEMINLLNGNFKLLLKHLNQPLNALYGNFLFSSHLLIDFSSDTLCSSQSHLNELSLYYKRFKKQSTTPKDYLFLSIIKLTEKCTIELKNYTIFTMKFSKLKPFNETVNSMINIIQTSTDQFIAKISLACVLFSEYESQSQTIKNLKKITIYNPISSNTTNSSSDRDMNSEIDVIEENYFLPPISNTFNYTLVVDLDETLVHYFQIDCEGTYFVRPYCFDFLEELYDKYELIIFTAGTKEYADRIIDKIDYKHKYFKHRLYRDHVSVSNYSIFKDLSKLGRDLTKTIIIDNLEDNFIKQPNNGLLIKTWNGNVDDTELFDMIKLLNDLFSLKIKDVREIVKYINKETKRMNVNKPYSGISLKDRLSSTSNNSIGEKDFLRKSSFKPYNCYNLLLNRILLKRKIRGENLIQAIDFHDNSPNENHSKTHKIANAIPKKKISDERFKSNQLIIKSKKGTYTSSLMSEQFKNIQEENYNPLQVNHNNNNNINNGENNNPFQCLQSTLLESNRNIIRVYGRVRPINKVEQELLNHSVGLLCLQHVTGNPNKDTIIIRNSITTGGNSFTFDKVFPSETIQKEVYNSVGKNIVQDVLSGYNGTIFAYGQSGSGKTHTMYGHDIYNDETKGIIPRLISDIFDHVNTAGENVTFQFKMSILQIYKEVIFDLITGEKDLKIKENPIKGIYVDKLTEVYINSIESFMSYIDLANDNRFVSETKLNSTSSRSHSILIFEVTQSFINESFSKKGTLNLVDLAGSEKISKTGASGEALEEAKKINLSLSSLGHVIYSLTSGSEHIPYRDSKLTRILQESLGGNFKTSLIVTCSPHSYHYEETLSTFQFAQRAKNIKNSVKINIKLSYDELQRIVTKLKASLIKAKDKIAYFKKLIPLSAYTNNNILFEEDLSKKNTQVSSQHNNMTGIIKNLTSILVNDDPLFHNKIAQEQFPLMKEGSETIEPNNDKKNILISECDELIKLDKTSKEIILKHKVKCENCNDYLETIQLLRNTIEKLNDEIKEKDVIISSLEDSNNNRAKQIKEIKDQAKSAYFLSRKESNEKNITFTNELYANIKAKLLNIENQQTEASKIEERKSHLNNMTNKLSNDIQLIFKTNLKNLFDNSSDDHYLLINSVSAILSKTLNIYNNNDNCIQDFNLLTTIFKERTTQIFESIFHFPKNNDINSSSNKEIKEKLLHLVSIFLFGYLDAYSSLQISLQLNFKMNTQNVILKNMNSILIEIIDELLLNNIEISQKYYKNEIQYLQSIQNKKRNTAAFIEEQIESSNSKTFQRSQVKIMTLVNRKGQDAIKAMRERLDLNSLRRNNINNNLDDSINSNNNNHEEEQKINNLTICKNQYSLQPQLPKESNTTSQFLKKQDKKRSKLNIMREYIIKTIQQTDSYKTELNNLKDSLIHTIKSIKKNVLSQLYKNGLIPVNELNSEELFSDGDSIDSCFNINQLLYEDNDTCKYNMKPTNPMKQRSNDMKKETINTIEMDKSRNEDCSSSFDAVKSCEKIQTISYENEIKHQQQKLELSKQLNEENDNVKTHRNLESLINNYLETGTATRKFDGIGVTIEGSIVQCSYKNGLNATNSMKKICMTKIGHHKGDYSKFSFDNNEDDLLEKK